MKPKITARRFGGEHLNDSTLLAYGIGYGDIGKYAAIQYGVAGLGVGKTPDQALCAASRACGRQVVDDVSANHEIGHDGDVEVVLVEVE
jgi:hypothetical protein